MASTTTSENGSRNDEWVVLPHGKLEKLADNLWWTWGSLPRMPLRRSMVVARRSDGRLVIHNAVALDEAGMTELEALGRPSYIIVPNAGHRLDAAAYKKRYPRTQLFAPRGALHAVEKVVKVDGIYEDVPLDRDVRFEMLHGVADAEGAMIVRSPDGVTVVLDDVVMAPERNPLRYLVAMILRSAPGLRLSRVLKLVFAKNRRALREDLERFAEHPDLVRLVVAYDRVARGPAAAQALRKAATYL